MSKLRAGLWTLTLGIVGFAISWLFSDLFTLDRNTVVLAYLSVGGAVLIGFFRSVPGRFREHLMQHWPAGFLVGLTLGALLSVTVAAQPSSPAPSGRDLAWALVWLGVVYGLLDAFLLNIAPVVAVTASDHGSGRFSRRLRQGSLALTASAFVTAAYHLGYSEFRGPQLRQPLTGNAILTAGYIVSGSMVAPLIGHVIMHGASVLHGMETTTQLPPHYPP